MVTRIKKFLEFASKNGLYLAMAYDNDKPGPSVTLLFAHLANAVALVSIIILISKDTVQGTIAAILYSVITMVLYIMRRITKFKVDLDDKSIDLEGGDKKDETNT